MKIVVLDGHALNPGDLSWDWLEEFGQVSVYERTPDELAAQRIGDAQIVLLNKTPITRSLLECCPSVKLICVLATGYNVVDCAAAKEKGVIVCNVPDYGTAAVAQFTMALLLELCSRVGHHDNLVHNGVWSACPDFCFWDTPQWELAGKTMGIIGFGRIGRAVGQLAKAFGMEVLAYNPSRCEQGQAIGRYVELDALLKQSDIVSLHCPLKAENTGLMNAAAIGKMKDGAWLLNTARGGLLDEQAVADALNSGKLGGAAVDVVSVEPIRKDNPLLTAKNCIITPHMAWAPVESRRRIIDCTIRSIRGFLAGEPINTV